MFSKFLSVAPLVAILVSLLGVSACDNKPLEIAKAVKSFDTDQQRDEHVADMRKNHMGRLMHKRDQTMYDGVRTPKHSLKACIDCHVPAPTESKVVRHTDSEHFCVTCHEYVSVQLDCFQCHADHPDKPEVAAASNTPPASNLKVATESSSTEAMAQ
ncbi:MAG TPA: hypothetical protein EYG68_12805 [Leucothrix mucor]|nr:hypothetical protein [Leucothrix mucor]